MKIIVIALAVIAAPVLAGQDKQTVIVNASNGGIRDYQAGAPGEVFLRDRTERWYRVALTGDCLDSKTDQAALSFSTDTTGTFDRFSRVSSSRFPGRVCGVKSIVASPPPPGQPGASDDGAD
jgi:hypothetical protein